MGNRLIQGRKLSVPECTILHRSLLALDMKPFEIYLQIIGAL